MQSDEASFEQAKELLRTWSRWSTNPQPNMLTISISRTNLLKAIEALLKAKWGYLTAITGLHIPGVGDDQADGDSFVVLYHFVRGSAVLSLRVHPPSLEDATVPSVCGLIPSATLYERELQEMFGITVMNTPDSSHFLLPDEWPLGVFPLRKDFQSLEALSHVQKDQTA